jgi:hypothetical protein
MGTLSTAARQAAGLMFLTQNALLRNSRVQDMVVSNTTIHRKWGSRKIHGA